MPHTQDATPLVRWNFNKRRNWWTILNGMSVIVYQRPAGSGRYVWDAKVEGSVMHRSPCAYNNPNEAMAAAEEAINNL